MPYSSLTPGPVDRPAPANARFPFRLRALLLLPLLVLLAASPAIAQLPVNVGVGSGSGGGLVVDVRVLTPLEPVGTLSLDVELLTQDSLLSASLAAGEGLPGLNGLDPSGQAGLPLPGLDGFSDPDAAPGHLDFPCEGPNCPHSRENGHLLAEMPCDEEGCEPEVRCEEGEGECVLDMPEERPVVLHGVTFEFASARLTTESRDVLDRALAHLRENPDTRFAVYGHTDSLGNAAYNLELSRQRAQAVHDYFVEAGIDPQRLVYRGYGDTRPIAPNTHDDGRDNPEGRARNRRVELEAVSAETLARLEAENRALEMRARLEEQRVALLARQRQREVEQRRDVERRQQEERRAAEQRDTAPAYDSEVVNNLLPAESELRAERREEGDEPSEYHLEVVPLRFD